jgi:aminoglycoside 6'-N-acetyltransferase
VGGPHRVRIDFRPLERSDFPRLSTWLWRPHVKQWWADDPDPPSVERRYGPVVDGTDPTEVFIVEVDGRPAGVVQSYRFADNPGWRRSLEPSGEHVHAVGIDYLIGDETLVGIGAGPTMIGLFVDAIWGRLSDVDEIVVAVQQANRASWRALEKAGFERTWAGTIVSDDPGDAGPSYVYARRRP